MWIIHHYKIHERGDNSKQKQKIDTHHRWPTLQASINYTSKQLIHFLFLFRKRRRNDGTKYIDWLFTNYFINILFMLFGIGKIKNDIIYNV